MMAIYTRATKGGAEDLLREHVSADQHACFLLIEQFIEELPAFFDPTAELDEAIWPPP